VTRPLRGAFPEPKAFRRQFGVAPDAYRKVNAEARPG